MKMKLLLGLAAVLLVQACSNSNKTNYKGLAFLEKYNEAILDAYGKHPVPQEVKDKGKEYNLKFVDSMKGVQMKKRFNICVKLHDTMPIKMHAWSLKNSTEPLAPLYLRLAIDKMEMAQADFICAKWYEDFFNHFPNDHFAFEALRNAILKQELIGNVDKQLELSRKALKAYPNSEWSKSIKMHIDFLESGKITPDQQLDELIKKEKAQK